MEEGLRMTRAAFLRPGMYWVVPNEYRWYSNNVFYNDTLNNKGVVIIVSNINPIFYWEDDVLYKHPGQGD